jgi:hypothetical protein
VIAAGVAVLAPSLARLDRARVPVLVAAGLAHAGFVAQARPVAGELRERALDVRRHDLDVARVLTDRFPHATVALAGPGTDAWLGRHRIVGLAEAPSADVVVDRGAGARYPSFVRVAELRDAWERATDPEAAVSLLVPEAAATKARAALAGLEADRAEASWVLRGDTEVPLAALRIEGGVVVLEPRGAPLAFYSNGAASVPAPADGLVLVKTAGTPAAGQWPRLVVECGPATVAIPAGPLPRTNEACAVEAGDRIGLRFEEDVHTGTEDRNAFVWSMIVRSSAEP